MQKINSITLAIFLSVFNSLSPGLFISLAPSFPAYCVFIRRPEEKQRCWLQTLGIQVKLLRGLKLPEQQGGRLFLNMKAK